MIVRATRLAFATEDPVFAASLDLIGTYNISGTVGLRIDADSFMVAGKAGASEKSQLARGFGMVGVGMPFMDANPLVGVIDIAQSIIDRDRLDFILSDKAAEGAHP